MKNQIRVFLKVISYKKNSVLSQILAQILTNLLEMLLWLDL